MSLVVEDGTVVADAETYASLDYANGYWAKRSDAAWAALSDAEKEAALREAAQYLDGAYKWPGSIKNSEQPMQWPRTLLWDNSGRTVGLTAIPRALLAAQCELAKEASSSRLMASQDRGGMLASAIVGSLAVTYQSNAPGGRTFPFVDVLLRDISDGPAVGGVNVEAVRG